MRAVHGRDALRLVALLRNPADRLYAAFRNYGHYAKHYGPGARGFEAFVEEQARGGPLQRAAPPPTGRGCADDRSGCTWRSRCGLPSTASQ